MSRYSYQAEELMQILSDVLHLRIKSEYGADAELVRFLFDSDSGEFAYEVVVDGEDKYGSISLPTLGKLKLSPNGKVRDRSFTAEHQVKFEDMEVSTYHPRLNTKKARKKVEDMISEHGSDIDLWDIIDEV